MNEAALDQDAADAALDLIRRTGAEGMEVGFLRDDVPTDKADWYAHAQYRGARIISEHHRGPVEALEGLARRLLAGGVCTHCGKRIALRGKSRMQCRWTRHGRKWVRGCEEP